MDTSIDPVSWHHYLSSHSVVPAPRTILTGVGTLPPATVRTNEDDGRDSEWTWRAPTRERRADLADLDPVPWQDLVLAQLRVAVRRRTAFDVPVGVLLSGGLDSRLIVGPGARHRPDPGLLPGAGDPPPGGRVPDLGPGGAARPGSARARPVPHRPQGHGIR